MSVVVTTVHLGRYVRQMLVPRRPVSAVPAQMIFVMNNDVLHTPYMKGPYREWIDRLQLRAFKSYNIPTLGIHIHIRPISARKV